MSYLEKMKSITCFIFDVDGVFNDNKVLVQEDGTMLRTMNVRDGYAVKLAVRKGYTVAIITGGRSQGVLERFKGLEVHAENIFLGVENKATVFQRFVKGKSLKADNILYMGDDMPDCPVLRLVGLSTCPADAVPEAIAVSQYVSPWKGGEGCVRDVVEKVLKLRGDWQ